MIQGRSIHGCLHAAIIVASAVLSFWSTPGLADKFATAEFKKGVTAQRKGDYQKAHYIFSLLAGQGDRRAQHALGRLYEHGQGVQGSAQTALQWYRRAADQGHPDSEYRLAVAYAYGLGGYPQDNRLAVVWLERATVHGHGKARKMLAQAHERGLLGLTPDKKQAKYWRTYRKRKKNR